MQHARSQQRIEQSATWAGSRAHDAYTLLYMSGGQAFAPGIKEWIVRGLIAALPDLKMEEFFRIKKNWFSEFDCLILAVESKTGQLVAALASRWHQHERRPFFLHVTTQWITHRYQLSSLLKHMWAFHLQMLNRGPFGFPSLWALKTCHPAAFSALRLFARLPGVYFYPDIEAKQQDPSMAELARKVASRISLNLKFSADTGVIRGASVPAGFYSALPTTGKPKLARYFREHLSVDDRILCLLRISDEAAKRRILALLGAS